MTSKLIESQVVQNHFKSNNSFSSLDLSPTYQKADRELFVGLPTHSMIEYLLDAGNVSQNEVRGVSMTTADFLPKLLNSVPRN